MDNIRKEHQEFVQAVIEDFPEFKGKVSINMCFPVADKILLSDIVDIVNHKLSIYKGKKILFVLTIESELVESDKEKRSSTLEDLFLNVANFFDWMLSDHNGVLKIWAITHGC